MTIDILLANFERLAEAPNGIPKLRELILQLAVRGKLVPQDPDDEPASELLARIQTEKRQMIAHGVVPKPRLARPGSLDWTNPFRIPQSWLWTTLDQVASYIQRGKGPKYAERSDVPVVSQKCIQWKGFTMEPARFINPDSLDKYGPERFLRTGDLLWNSTGTGTIGRINVYEHELHCYERVVADSHVTVVRPLVVDARYLWSFLAGPDVQDGFEDRASGSTNQIELSTTAVRAQTVPIPPLAEQKRIVAKVGELMALCDDLEAKQQAKRTKQAALNRASLHALTQPNGTSLAVAWHRVRDHFDDLYTVPKTVAELRQTILQLAVMGRLVPQDPNDEPASELLKKIQAEKRRLIAEGKIRKLKPIPAIEPEQASYELPRSWEWIRIGRLGLGFQNGLAKRRAKDGTPTVVLRLADIVLTRISLANTREIPLTPDERAKYNLLPSDILITRVNGSIDLVGAFTLVRVSEDIVYCDHFIRVRLLHEHLSPRFLELFGKTRLCRDAIKAAFITTAGQKTVNQGHISALPFALPPFAEQKRIVAKVDRLMTLCDALEAKLQQTQTDADNLLTAIVHELTSVGEQTRESPEGMVVG